MNTTPAQQLEKLPEGRRRAYGPRRPWPRPPVPGQEGKGPTVTDLPWRTELEFQRAIGKRLIAASATGWIRPLAKSMVQPYPDELDDQKILDLLFGTVFCRFVTMPLSVQDENLFAPFLESRRPDEVDFKVDFSAVSRIHTLPGIYAAPTVTLGRMSPDGTKRLMAMHISGLMLTPADENAWALARYFFMQGAGLHGVLVHHTPLHFQFDAINAISISLLPPAHPLMRLLAPHFQFTLSLNRAALHSRLSILTNNQMLAFATFPGDSPSIHHFQATGWSGIEGNNAYPVYKFPRRPPPVYGELGVFLGKYYDVIRGFVGRVIETIPDDDPHIPVWADEISRWVPGFPDASEMRTPGLLGDVAAYIVWGTSVAHSTEHYGLMEDIPLGAIPLRLRVPPPFSRNMPPLDRRRLTKMNDIFRQRVAWEVLVADHAATYLCDSRYHFEADALRQANGTFLENLKQLDAAQTGRRFIPLKRVARSIQF